MFGMFKEKPKYRIREEKGVKFHYFVPEYFHMGGYKPINYNGYTDEIGAICKTFKGAKKLIETHRNLKTEREQNQESYEKIIHEVE